MEDDPLLTDLIPMRLGIIWLLFLLGIGGVAVILFLYFKLPEIGKIVEMERIATFDVTCRDSLASWMLAFVWGIASFASILVYIICRREQDYRRLSDIWIWGAIACLYLSLDQVAGLRILFRDVMVYSTGTQLYGDGSLWWVVCYLIVFGMIGTRILNEIHYYLPACNSLLMAGICFIVSACAELGFLLSDNLVQNAMLCFGAAAVGGMFLVLSVVLYGRRLIITDPTTLKRWYSPMAIFRNLPWRINPTMYKYKRPDSFESTSDYSDNGSHRPRHRQTAADVRARNEYWQDEDDLTPAEQETMRRRKGRIKKSKKGPFY